MNNDSKTSNVKDVIQDLLDTKNGNGYVDRGIIKVIDDTIIEGEHMTLREKVEHCLKEFPASRNSDVLLTAYIWKEFHDKQLSSFDEYYKSGKYKVYEILAGFMTSVPREDDVSRMRRIIQNDEGKYPPTDNEVEKQRKQKEKNWKEIITNQ